jgi:hypothetical protein
MRHVMFASLAFASVIGGAAACAQEDGSAELSGDAAEVNKSVLSDIAAVAFEDQRVVAAPKKVAALVGAISRPKEGKLKCLPTATFTFFGRSGDRAATLAMLCNPEEAESGKVAGQLDVLSGDGAARSFVVDFDVRVATEVRTQPPAIGDVLFGVDKLEMSRGIGETISTHGAVNVQRVTDAFDPDQVPRAGVAPKCLPEVVVTFLKGTKKVATAKACGTAAAFDAPGAHVSGALEHVDVADLKSLLEQLHQD